MNVSRFMPAMRVSLGMALVVISLILMSDMLGIIPDRTSAELEGRKELAETLAVQYSLAARKNDYGSIKSSMNLLVERNNNLVSAGLRTVRGNLLAAAGDHRSLWETGDGDRSTPTQIRVPIYKDTRHKAKWATLELRFEPMHIVSILGIAISPLVAMSGFMLVSVFLVSLLMMRRVFSGIDPLSAVPSRVRNALDTLTEGVLLIDRAGRIMFMNRVFSEYSRRSIRSLTGKKVGLLGWRYHENELPWERTLRENVPIVGEKISLACPGGDEKAFMVNCSLIADEKNRGQGVMATFDDVTELDAKNDELNDMVFRLRQSADQISLQNEELQKLATCDSLTGCLNRRSLFDRYDSDFTALAAAGERLSCIMMDVDHFKKINDAYGHATGDKVLVAIASAAQGILRQNDNIFRYGGEEFCILLGNTDEDDACIMAERVRVAIESLEIENGDEYIRVTTSLGVSTLDPTGDSLAKMIDRADKALYLSKNGGRNRLTVWREGSEPAGISQETASDAPAAGPDSRDPDTAGAGRSDSAGLSRSGGDEWHEALYGITGLPDRNTFRRRLEQAIEGCSSDGTQVAVVMLDVDMFQRINATLGQAKGDRILKILAGRLYSSTRNSDTIERLGESDAGSSAYRLDGDEFGVLLVGLHARSDAETAVDRIISVLSRPVTMDGQEIFLTCGAGVSVCPGDGDTPDILINGAGLALLQAKQLGTGKYCFYDSEYADSVRSKYRIEHELRRAIDNREFELYYQPKLDIKTLKIDSMEALVRWNDPEKGIRPPAEFIPAAESSGLVNPLGEWIMYEAFRQVREWLDAGYEIQLSINLSPVQFRQKDIVDRINAAISNARVDPRLIELEITESAIIEDEDAAIVILRSLARCGYRISMDDFGTGYSSFDHLKRFPIDALKIDRSFVKGIDEGEDEKAIVRAIVEMAHTLGLQVVAEGVETDSQLEALREIGCDQVQGFLLGHPLPASGAIRLFRESNPPSPVASF